VTFEFPPNPGRAVDINRRMHRCLASSLRHVCERCRGVIAFDEPAMQTLICGLERGDTFPPLTFSDYYDLVPAVVNGDFDTAAAMFEALAASAPVSGGMRVVALGDASLGRGSDRYLRLMNSDDTLSLGLLPPSPELAAEFRIRLNRGLELVDRAVPELAGEIRSIVNEIVIVAGDPTKKLQFDGGSHYQLWGALFLNAQFHRTDHAVAEVLAHESAHSLLFGFCTDSALVENGDDERYRSPLRTDLRPMDGIYHATFVSARMHWAMSRLLDSGVLDDEASEAARTARDGDVRNFWSGYDIVAEHGRLTDLGRALMEGAHSYMETVAAP
jgi:HEXXH motif-containing protein